MLRQFVSKGLEKQAYVSHFVAFHYARPRRNEGRGSVTAALKQFSLKGFKNKHTYRWSFFWTTRGLDETHKGPLTPAQHNKKFRLLEGDFRIMF